MERSVIESHSRSWGTVLPEAQSHSEYMERGGMRPSCEPRSGTGKAINLIVQPLLSKALALSFPISLLDLSSRSLVLCLGLQAWSMWWHSDGDTGTQAVISQDQLRFYYSNGTQHIRSTCRESGTILKALYLYFRVINQSPCGRSYYYPHFTNEAKRSWVTCH